MAWTLIGNILELLTAVETKQILQTLLNLWKLSVRLLMLLVVTLALLLRHHRPIGTSDGLICLVYFDMPTG